MRSTALFALLVLATAARGDLPSPRLDRVLPLGAAAGSSVEVELSGPDLDDANRLFFDHPGITSAHVKDKKFAVTVAKDVPPGTYDARVVGRYGVSSPRLFAVSNGFAEVAEAKGNDTPETAQPVAVNSIINGTADASRDDYFRFAAKKGQRVVVECQAAALDSPLTAALALTTADGRPLATNGGYHGRDPLVEFAAPADGEYLVSLHDLAYRGGLPYRLLVTDRPHVENVFPRAVQVGGPASLTAFGRNLPGGKPSPWVVNDLPLDAVAFDITPPRDVFPARGYSFRTHPTAHSVMPTAATCTLAGFQAMPFGGTVPMVLCDTPVSAEAEPNDDPKAPQPLTLPAVVSGRFDKERDADWYTFETTDTGLYGFDVYCERIAGRADPYLVVLDEKDNRVGELDDAGARVNGFDGHLRDPSGTVNLSAKKTYRVMVQDRYRRGGGRLQYVLSVRKAEPDVFAAAISGIAPGPAGVNVRRGGTAFLDLVLHRKDGYADAVTVVAGGLPTGVHAAPVGIPTDARGTLVLWADADAPAAVAPISLTAEGTAGGEKITRGVRPYTRVWQEQNLGTSRPTRELVVAVVPEPDPFALRFDKDRVEVEAGGKAELKVLVSRPGPDFTGAVTVTPLAFPGPIKLGQVTVAEGKAEAAVTVEVQAGAKPGEYTAVAQGQEQVPFARDTSKGGAKPNTLVARAARPLTVVVLPKK